MKKIVALLLTLSLVLALFACANTESTGEETTAPSITENLTPDPVTLDFYAHTDLLGNLQATDVAPGMAVFAAAQQKLIANNPEGSFLFCLGDSLSGTPVAALVDGKSVVESMNLMPYDTFTLGNHEFDWGPETLCSTIADFQIPVLCANVVDNSTGEALKGTVPYVIAEKNGVKVGILGLITEATPTIIRAEYAAQLTFTDSAEAAAKYVPEMRDAGAEIVVIAGHLPLYQEEGSTEYTGELLDILTQVKGIDLAFGGHNETLLIAESLNGVPTVKSAFYGTELSHISLTFDRTSKTVVDSICESISIADLGIAEGDASVADVVAKYSEEADRIFDATIGIASADCEVDYFYECSIGNWFSNAVKDATGADMAFINPSGIFESVPAGDITLRKIYQMSPFENELVTAPITGAQLKELWETTLETERMPQYGTLAFAGICITFDSAKADGEKVLSLTLSDGSEITDDAVYTIATLDFLAGGGNDYTLLPSLEWTKTAIMMRDAYAKALTEMGSLSPELMGWMTDISLAN